MEELTDSWKPYRSLGEHWYDFLLRFDLMNWTGVFYMWSLAK